MKVVGILIFVALAIFVTWFLIDTIIMAVKKSKQKKLDKELKKNDEVINGDKK